MLEHHLQREILYTLVTNPSVRYSKLKPEGIDGNIFTYHLQQLIKQKLVVKRADGSYSLTALGKAAGINSNQTMTDILMQAHSILLMAARNHNGDYLLRKRLAHPVYGKSGFVHGEPVAEEAIELTAARIFKTKTGMDVSFKPRGSGYIRIFRENDIESFTHFTILSADGVEGEPIQTSKTGENSWVRNADFRDESMIPSMHDLVSRLEKPDFFFCDLTYNL